MFKMLASLIRRNKKSTWASGVHSAVLYCLFGFKGASTSQVIGARNEMRMYDYDGQMIFGDLVALKLPDIRLTVEEKPRKNLTQETCPDRGSNPGPLRDKRACYHLFHSGGHSAVLYRPPAWTGDWLYSNAFSCVIVILNGNHQAMFSQSIFKRSLVKCLLPDLQFTKLWRNSKPLVLWQRKNEIVNVQF